MRNRPMNLNHFELAATVVINYAVRL